MNETREKLLQLAREKDISSMGLREIARELGIKNPQNIKFHMSKLQANGQLNFTPKPSVRIESEKLGSSALVRIPILGSVSAGPATQIASDTVQGYVRVSSALLKSRNYKDLFALRVVGKSMNRASVNGSFGVNDGDLVIADSSRRSPKNLECVIAVVDGLANIKRLFIDETNKQVVLLSESSEDYAPIFVHQDDSNEELIRGTVIQVMRRPTISPTFDNTL